MALQRSAMQPELVQMRERGIAINGIVRGAGLESLKLPIEIIREGPAITESPNFRFLIGQEIKYSAANPLTGGAVDETWIRVMRGGGVTILPLVVYEGKKSPVLILKPQPSVDKSKLSAEDPSEGSWSIECISGGLRRDTIEGAAARELLEEAGLEGAVIRIMKEGQVMWHAPHRLNTTDTMVIIENVRFAGRSNVEKEELPISPFIATWREVAYYLDNNVIRYAASIATLRTHLDSLMTASEQIRLLERAARL